MSSDPQKKRERIESAIMEQLNQRFGDAGIPRPSQISQAALLHSLRYLFGAREHRGILYGETAPFILTTAEGLEETTIRFALVEQSLLIPSHIPEDSGYLPKNPSYPNNLQERAYHADAMEAEKIRNNLRQFKPFVVINDNPDAVNGAPIVDKNLLVLGGNSRTMTIQLMYRSSLQRYRQTAARYVGYLASKAVNFGFTIGEVLSFEQPVLVRVLDFDALANMGEARRLVRLLNESLTQELGYTQQLVALSRAIPAKGWNQIASIIAKTMGNAATFNEYMKSGRSDDLVQELRRLGVFNIRNFSVYFDEGSKEINRIGRTFIKDLLMGRLFMNSPETLQSMGDQRFDLFSELAPFLLASSCCDPTYDLQEDLIISLDAADYMRSAKRKDGEKLVSIYPSFTSLAETSQLDLFYVIPPEIAPALETIRRRFLLQLLYEYESKRSYLARGFRRYSLRAIAQDASQSDLGGIAGEYGETANDALLWAFQAKRVQPQTSARRAEFDIADPILVEKVDPDHSFSVASFVHRGKTYNFEYFVSYRDLVRRGLALDADKQGDSIQGGDLFEEAQQPRLFNPRRRVTNHDPRAAAWEVSRR